MLIDNPQGRYRFLKGISPYSAGAVAMPGYEIERVCLHPPLPLREGFAAVDQRLRAEGRPRHALCAMELRSPRPFSFQGFSEFNAGYVEILKSWDLLVHDLNPVARTNIAPELAAPSEPALFAFSYTVPTHDTGTTFVVAGAGELPEGSLDPHDVVRRGETSPEALDAKARFVMELMEQRLHGLGADWPGLTAADIYTVHNIHPFLAKTVLATMREAAGRGVTWHYARPPIVSIEYEMDMRGCRREIVLETRS